VLGPALVRYRDDDGEDGARVVERILAPGEAVRFTFPAGVSHAMRNNGDAPLLILSFNTAEHHRDQPDVVRDVLIEA
jgi:uncharacterized cupin superfamily protein